jgi:hypothetical protein
VEETTLFIIQKKVGWRVEKLLTKFVDDFEAVDDDRVEVGKDIGRYHGSSLAQQPVHSFQLLLIDQKMKGTCHDMSEYI